MKLIVIQHLSSKTEIPNRHYWYLEIDFETSIKKDLLKNGKEGLYETLEARSSKS
jgi:hypothetical protein